ncbi:MAG: hypothetical protein WC943_00405 [Elusimicrobiota bacterium]|jgi:TPR repeat protein
MTRPRRSIASLLLAAALTLSGRPAPAQEWPDLSAPARPVGGGAGDAAVIVGIEDYAFVPDVPGAEANAKAWFDYLTATRGTPPQNIRLLTGMDATRDEILDAVHAAAAKAGPSAALWFVFVGHGAPAKDGKDGLLVAVDAQQKAKSLERYSLRRGELLKALSLSKAGSIQVILDACFSGRVEGGGSLAPGLQPLVAVAAAGASDPRMSVLTAAKGDQFAGALPGEDRPAFSYLVLGGLRGWAAKGTITAKDLWRYASDALEATLRGRDQTPELTGAGDAPIAASPGEQGPDLAGLSKATAGGAATEMFRVSALPSVPRAEAPKALSADTAGLDFRGVDVAALRLYEHALEADKGEDPPQSKAEVWRSLSQQAPKFSGIADKRASAWEDYASQRKAAAEARDKALKARDEDWAKLSDLLDLKVVSDEEKKRWAVQFAQAYSGSTGLTASMSLKLLPLAPVIRLMTMACDSGQSAACTGLAVCHLLGNGVPENKAKAETLYRKACGLGDAQGCNDLADSLRNRDSGGLEAEASGFYRKACEGDFGLGCANLAYMREDGIGVDKDESLAAKTQARACGLGYHDSCVSAGIMHEFGKGVPKDEARAAELYRQACEAGVGRGCTSLGVMHENGKGMRLDPAHAAALYLKACETLADHRGCSFLGALHLRGKGVEKDDAKALALYGKACDNGFWEGCVNLGVMFENGSGTAKDMAKAAGAYRQACDGGHQPGCAALGIMHQYGRGVAKDPAKAAGLFRKACDLGSNEGCSNLGGCYANGEGVVKDLPKAAALLGKSCEAGYQPGCVNLGTMLLNGFGITKDEARAIELYRKACDADIGHGCFNLAASYDNGQGVPQDGAKAAPLYKRACGLGFSMACMWAR